MPQSNTIRGEVPRRVHIDAAIAALTAEQHGVVARSQLLSAGISVARIEHRLRDGRLKRRHAGVYQVGALVSPHAHEMAAVLACGEGSVLCYRSAGLHWGLLGVAQGQADVDVNVHGNRGRRRGIRRHRARLHPDEVTEHLGIPITTPERTLFDLAKVLGARELERAAARAERLSLLRRDRLERLLARHARHPATRRLRGLLFGPTRPALTRSEAEERFLSLVRAARVAEPEANVMVAGWEVDFYWRRARLVVEVDGRAYHTSPAAYERDRRRDQDLAAARLYVMRVTWKHLTEEPIALVARLVMALAEPAGGAA